MIFVNVTIIQTALVKYNNMTHLCGEELCMLDMLSCVDTCTIPVASSWWAQFYVNSDSVKCALWHRSHEIKFEQFYGIILCVVKTMISVQKK